ncbi:hypothetical protein [Anaeromyxobacter oryzisoli]|uniref:hypothetical protein n=1 Tax=Anaeromyxobacter oryzisoli TaxID=2925408 RepID=UPI001F56C733|nr:hypothetical protein [Anaeromyxobacter sp. SG63]
MNHHPTDPAVPLPRVGAYLAKLPAGVSSYPECLAKGAMLRRALESAPLSRRHLAALPPTAAQLVICPPLDGDWIPDVSLACVLLAIADVHLMTDEAYLSWMRALNVSMFTTVFRGVVTGSPDALVRSAAERWGLFHRGSAISVLESSPGHAVVQLSFPAHLFHGLVLRQFVAVFEAVLALAGPAGRAALASSDDDGALFTLAWTA